VAGAERGVGERVASRRFIPAWCKLMYSEVGFLSESDHAENKSGLESWLIGCGRDLGLASRLAGDRMMAAFDRLCGLIAKDGFNPDQPRVPAGGPDAGQWTSGEPSVGPGSDGNPLQSLIAATNRGLRAVCEAQLDRDIFQCRMVGLRSCYEQAYQRYASCLARQPIPPFNY